MNIPNLDSVIHDFLKKHNIAIENLTESQTAIVFKQAILCGDFIRHVHVTNNAQQVIYIPYAREQELESRILRLEETLQQNNIEDPDKLLPCDGD